MNQRNFHCESEFNARFEKHVGAIHFEFLLGGRQLFKVTPD